MASRSDIPAVRTFLVVAWLLLACSACTSKSEREGRQVQPELPRPPTRDSAPIGHLETLRKSSGDPQIAIVRIEPDNVISGHVSGIAAGDAQRFKVVVYVHTDQWYVHPFAGQGEGDSWATVNPDLSWNIKTLQRQYTANEIGALLIERDATVPATIGRIDDVPSRAWVVIRGTGGL